MHEEKTSWMVDQAIDRMGKAVNRTIDRPEDWDLTESCIDFLVQKIELAVNHTWSRFIVVHLLLNPIQPPPGFTKAR